MVMGSFFRVRNNRPPPRGEARWTCSDDDETFNRQKQTNFPTNNKEGGGGRKLIHPKPAISSHQVTTFAHWQAKLKIQNAESQKGTRDGVCVPSSAVSGVDGNYGERSLVVVGETCCCWVNKEAAPGDVQSGAKGLIASTPNSFDYSLLSSKIWELSGVWSIGYYIYTISIF